MYRTVFFLALIVVWSACNQTQENEKAESSADDEGASQKAVMHKDSELAAWMKDMHEKMFVVRDHLEKGEPVPDSINWDWEAIYEAKRKNDDARGTTFNGMAKVFLTEMEKSLKDRDVEAYNHAVRTCVNCHENYCPGPIPKIKKLKIEPADRVQS